MRPAAARLFTSDEGRVHLPWRLSGYFGLVIVVGVGAGLLFPGGLAGQGASLLVAALVAGWLLLALDGRAPAALGFPLGRGLARESLQGLALGVCVGLLVVAGMALLGAVSWTAQDGGLADWIAGAGSAMALLALPAAAEEALLRGYPLQALAESWGGGWAVAVTAVVFGAMHLLNPGAGWLTTVNVTVAGLFLGAVLLRTASLWWASGAHLGWNWSHGYVADLPVSGLEVVDAPMYEGMTSGPVWLGGGVFGPEGSVLSTLVLAGAAAACWWGPWLRPGEAARSAHPLHGKDLERNERN